MILISACLCGVDCKYNGGNNKNEKISKLLEEGKAIPLCPEQLGGMATPRDPSEIVNGDGKKVLEGKCKVLSNISKDVTDNFVKGAYEALKIAKAVKAEKIILKSKSPSCGKGIIYDGSFSGTKKQGNGVACELLLQNGFDVITEEEF